MILTSKVFMEKDKLKHGNSTKIGLRKVHDYEIHPIDSNITTAKEFCKYWQR